jgi:hypothetical protein
VDYVAEDRILSQSFMPVAAPQHVYYHGTDPVSPNCVPIQYTSALTIVGVQCSQSNSPNCNNYIKSPKLEDASQGDTGNKIWS